MNVDFLHRLGSSGASCVSTLLTAIFVTTWPATAGPEEEQALLILKIKLCAMVRDEEDRLQCFDRISGSRRAGDITAPTADAGGSASAPASTVPRGAGASRGALPPMPPQAWSISDRTSPITGERDVMVSRAFRTMTSGGVVVLSLACGQSGGSVAVSWPGSSQGFPTGLSLTLGGGQHLPDGFWTPGRDGRSLVHEGSRDVVRFAAAAISAGQMMLTLGGKTVAELRADGLESHLDALRQGCETSASAADHLGALEGPAGLPPERP